MTTAKELAEQLGVSKQSIMRYAKTELGVAPEPRKAVQFDANQTSAIAAHFADKKLPKLQQTAINDSDMAQIVAALERDVAALEAENEQLRERVRELKEDKEQLHKALERQQMIGGGFWSRLGRKLLGEGKSDQS